MKFNIKKVRIQDVKIRIQDDAHAGAELPEAKAISKNQVPFDHIECVSPMTFSQKLYQSHALEIAEECEQALDANSLERFKKLLDKVLES